MMLWELIVVVVVIVGGGGGAVDCLGTTVAS